MHPVMISDRDSQDGMGRGRFSPLAGLFAVLLGALIAGATGAAMGLILLLLLLQIGLTSRTTRH
jgi:hypothetical protein